MFGLDPEELSLEPVEIGDQIFIPYHISDGNQEVSYFMTHETLKQMNEEAMDDSLGTDDFRVGD